MHEPLVIPPLNGGNELRIVIVVVIAPDAVGEGPTGADCQSAPLSLAGEAAAARRKETVLSDVCLIKSRVKAVVTGSVERQLGDGLAKLTAIIRVPRPLVGRHHCRVNPSRLKQIHVVGNGDSV